ncbi:MAG: biotin/lipoate A/B protein ligase family protein [Thermoplasmata archaeon]
MGFDFRLICHEEAPAAWNMAVDEAILSNMQRVKKRGENPLPTVRFYAWKPSAVSIGYFQSLLQEVDIGKCREREIDIVRRITGGGAVYHDTEGEITYSIILPQEHQLAKGSILETYRRLCEGIIVGLSFMNIEAQFVPINDIVVNSKKISGNAQTRRYDGILQHGTILLKVDPSVMFSVLKVPDEKIREKLIASVQERVTSVERILGRAVNRKEVLWYFVDGFSKALNASFIRQDLTQEEIVLAEELEKKFSSDEWTGRR